MLDAKDSGTVTIPLIIKADVNGSLEAISDMLATFPSNQLRLSLASSGVGPVTLAEVEMAAAVGGACVCIGILNSYLLIVYQYD